jgi:tRNA threonylcarbamoyladenosine biosynthesis protein TsaB
VSTLEALAYGARKEASLICPIISAGTRDAVYAAFYRAKGDNITRAGEYYVGSVRGLVEMADEATVFVGSGEQLHSLRVFSDMRVKTLEAVPHGAVMARLAAIRLEQGDSDDVLSLTPLYLKESTAKAFISRYTRVEG